jgi:hypothetical protein
MVNTLPAYYSNSDRSGDSKTFIATIVANVATERMRMDTTELKDYDNLEQSGYTAFIKQLQNGTFDRDFEPIGKMSIKVLLYRSDY